ncbi:dTDP-4-dehydrorhamnose reductase [Mycobacterium antarcticum]|uniref:dTDP-4-dehydrorhamnose reductase n=1 Tax=unclassified Mycolicibacterium TaxID=2636767 RepID=UPI0023A67ECC|nr:MULTISPECIES: dTDP-4-dehydrorhamnose reductase [unclassified Mycolicibacterium]GLP77028.1 dTDP-4-dehydrorhamnose reductase [Mycolicibacterium sp. TUM20983]
MSERLVITGAGGLVGRRLATEAARRGHDVLALTSAECDVTDPTAPERHFNSGDVVLNCAAYTKVDQAESDEAGARAVNVGGAENVAHACARAGAELIHVSTDYVFSGDFGGGEPRPYEIDDETGPTSVYGRTKLEGEFAVLSAMPSAHVVRTAWIFSGGDGGDFVATMRRLAAGDGSVDVVADQLGSPTYVGDLVGALLEVAGGSIEESVLHAANQGATSRFEQARAVFELVGADPERVRPVGTDQHPRPAPRPPYSALAARRSADAGLTPLRPWRDALAAALADCPLPSTP